ncbi:MAG TPA: hypothetical protein VIG33_06570 [Pseudobdellovibrionaceae bacterium]|jgi:hypothetical protein
MNRIFVLIALISFTAFSANAEEATEDIMQWTTSEVSVTPTRPGSCQSSAHVGVNRIFEVEIYENDSLILVSFKTEHGPCGHRETMNNPHVKIIGDAFYSLFDTYPAEGTIYVSNVNPALGLVNLTFDKKRIFKNSSVATFAYSLILDQGYEFRWNVKLTQLLDHTTLLIVGM